MVSFVDEVRLFVRAGNGGHGCVSVHREKFKPLGGPDGGNGGHGGDIVLVADPQETTLLAYHARPHRSAPNGLPGAGDHRTGAAGDTVELPVPVGTCVRSAAGEPLADLAHPGMRFVVAPGGLGGRGNAALATTRRKAPGFALLGTPGWEGEVILELKTVADVALVGYPSAGKSSLIAAMSAARPKIADYPFTTLHPNLGVVQAGDYRYTIADVPGLVPGASEGRGLGLEFLRHVERCSVLVHILDCAALELDRDPVRDLDTILSELNAYPVADGQLPLTARPAVVALNKLDVTDARVLADLVRPDLEARGFRVFPVSAATREGLRELGFALGSLVAEAQITLTAEPPRTIIRPKPVDAVEFTIAVEGSSSEPVYVVSGTKPERWVWQTDFANDEAVGYLADRLARVGVEDELVRLGAEPGATVRIGATTFDWEPHLTSTAEVVVARRGTDERLNAPQRASRAERRERYHERMDAKAEARAELEGERVAGLWADADTQDADTQDPDIPDAETQNAGPVARERGPHAEGSSA